MFEDEIAELQIDMVDICNEYSCGVADKIYIYVGYENLQFVMPFYQINNNLLMPEELNKSGLDIDFDVSGDCQDQVLDILNEDTDKIIELFEKNDRPRPTEMRIIYDLHTKKFDVEYKYDPQTNDHISVFDNQEKWFEEEKAAMNS